MTVFWSRAHRQRHVTICLMKFAVGERNVAMRYIYFVLGCVIWIWLSYLIQPDERLQTFIGIMFRVELSLLPVLCVSKKKRLSVLLAMLALASLVLNIVCYFTWSFYIRIYSFGHLLCGGLSFHGVQSTLYFILLHLCFMCLLRCQVNWDWECNNSKPYLVVCICNR